jgi:TM2 domain-containing membrane protein YozV
MGRLCLAVIFLMACLNVQARYIEYNDHGKAFCIIDTSKNTVLTDTTVQPHKHKLIAAALAFPLGVFGLHRIYLGSSKGMPVAYIATFGGAFGVLPFIDFVLILISKDVNTYANNPHLFMWSRPKKKNK